MSLYLWAAAAQVHTAGKTDAYQQALYEFLHVLHDLLRLLAGQSDERLEEVFTLGDFLAGAIRVGLLSCCRGSCCRH